MKIRQEDNLLLTNGKNEKKFTIQASAKAFQILSSALYSRKIEAIIRELSCNAHDSHISAGYGDLPFEVHLPNQWAPEFYVEDFGIGLDADDIETIYTSYFTSTKTDTNDLTGGFGLGSKTPFSYTDSFNIRTRKDGIEYHFNAYINMGGEPSTSLLSSAPTTERNGVRVSVPVKSTDYYQFYTDAETVYNWFPVLPNIIGYDIELNNSKAIRLAKEGYFWSEYQKDGYERNTISAVMGNVAYHVPKVSETFTNRLTQAERQFFANNSLYIKFKIGDLDVNAGRESLSFDEDTEDTFIARIKEVIGEFSKELQEQLDTQELSIPGALALVEDSVGMWARSLFSYKGTDIQTLASKNFVTALRDIFELEPYYFSRTSRGQVKRHSLDYIHYMTFAKLGQSRIVIMQGNEPTFQRFAKKLADVSSNEQYGVFFTNNLLTDEEKDKLNEVFGDLIELEVAADLIAADKATRKAIRDANKAAGIVTPRKAAVNRIGSDSVRARTMEVLTSATTGAVQYNESINTIVTAATLVDKRYLLLEDRYGRVQFPFFDAHNNVNTTASIGSGNTSEMYSFARFFNIDLIVMVKTESFAKATKLFGAGALEVAETFNAELANEVRVCDYMGTYGEEVSAKSVVYRTANIYYGVIHDMLCEQLEQYVADNPDAELSKFIASGSNYNPSLSYSVLPYEIKSNFDHEPAREKANNMKEIVTDMLAVIKRDHPMLDVNEDASDEATRQYIKDMAELKEFRRIKETAVQEV